MDWIAERKTELKSERNNVMQVHFHTVRAERVRNSTTCLVWPPAMDFRPFGPGYQAKVQEVQYRGVQSQQQQQLCS